MYVTKQYLKKQSNAQPGKRKIKVITITDNILLYIDERNLEY